MSQLSEQKAPLFSVIMPAYNAGGYIAQSIASVLSQTLGDWELLVMDDASVDETESIVRAIAEQDPRVIYDRLASMRKPSKVRNEAFKRAKGKYIAFLDADDLYEPRTLEQYAEYFENNPSARAVYGQYVEINEHDQEIANEYAAKPLAPTWETLLNAKTHHQLQALAVERDLMADIGGFKDDILFSEDWVFYIELLDRLKENLGVIRQTVFKYRIYENSISRDSKRAFEVLHSFDELFGWFRHAKLSTDARKHFSDFIASNYVYFLMTRIQHKQWSVLLAGLFKAAITLDLKGKDWLRCAWVCLKGVLPAPCQNVANLFKKSLLKPGYAYLLSGINVISSLNLLEF